MIVIGVTGSVGTGKSTVARLFGERGARVLDADRIVHELMEPGAPVWKRIRRKFGPDMITAGGRIDRKRLGERVFASPKRLKELNAIVHPAVRRRIQERLRQIRREDSSAVVVLDIPLLVEAGPAYRTDALVVASASASVAERRLKRRSGWSAAEFRRRRSFQLPLKLKERRADFVVNNGGSLRETRRQVSFIWKKIVKERD